MFSKKYYIFLFVNFVYINNIYSQQSGNEDDFKKAEIYFFQNKYGASKQLLLQVIKTSPSHPKAFSYLGDISLVSEQYDEALQYYQIAKDLSANPGMEFFRMGQIYIKLKKPDEAIKAFQTAVELNSSLKQSYFQVGYVWLVLKREKQHTIEYWQKYLDIAPQDPQYEDIKRAIALLSEEDFVIPDIGSDVSLEEALMLGGKTIEAERANAKDKTAGNEKEKTSNRTEGLLDKAPIDDL